METNPHADILYCLKSQNQFTKDMTDCLVSKSDYLIFCCVPQALKDVEIEHLGRRSADSVRRMSSSRYSTRGRSHKRRLGQEPVTTRTEEKVKKRNMNPINVMLFLKKRADFLSGVYMFESDDYCCMLSFIYILVNLCIFFFYSFLFFSTTSIRLP